MQPEIRDLEAQTLYESLIRTIERGIKPGQRFGNILQNGISNEWSIKFEKLGAKVEQPVPGPLEYTNREAARIVFEVPESSAVDTVLYQYVKMRSLKGHTVEDDVKHNTNGELALAGTLFGVPDSSSMDHEDFKELCEKFLPDWNQEWLLKTRERTYKDRLKVGISLLIAELERVMYLENQRISNNDSSTASSSGDPESNG